MTVVDDQYILEVRREFAEEFDRQFQSTERNLIPCQLCWLVGAMIWGVIMGLAF